MADLVSRRLGVLSRHLQHGTESATGPILTPEVCLSYERPEVAQGKATFDIKEMRKILDLHNLETRDELYALFAREPLFRLPGPRKDSPIYTFTDYNSTMETQRELTFRRLLLLRDLGYFKNWLTSNDEQEVLKKAALHEALSLFDNSASIKLGVHVHLWGASIKYLGTERHHEKYLALTEDYKIAGCFALTELGHGSNVRGIETEARYDPMCQEFVINTPCESAQKYWIGGAAMHANHTVAFAQLTISGEPKGVHAFVVRIRDEQGNVCPGIRILDCGHKMGLNGVDNGRIWFDNTRVPRESLLNRVADVTPDGCYVSSFSDPEQRFAAFMAPLTGGRVTLAVSAINQCKLGLSTALRYSLTRACFAPADGQPEVLLLDYPSHQRRLLPLLAKTYTMQFAANQLKMVYVRRKPLDSKAIHIMSSGYKAMLTWHLSRTLQECREACGGMGYKSENRIGQLKGEYDVMSTFEGDNWVLLQQVSKALVVDFMAAKKKGKPITGLGLEHLNGPKPTLPQILSSTTLRDPYFQLALFRLRERSLLERLASQVGASLSRGKTLFDALNLHYQLAADLGRAHAERAILEAAAAGTTSQPSKPIKTILLLLEALFVATVVDEDPVFLRYGFITPDQAQAVHKEVTSLCSAIRPHTLALLDSFGIPGHLLGPIAFDWIEQNTYDNCVPQPVIAKPQAQFDVMPLQCRGSMQ